MVTVVNNPQPASSDGDGGMGFVVGLILVIVLVFVIIYYGLPAIRSAVSTPQINIPGKVDINVNQTK